MNKCIKCGSDDVITDYVKEDAVINHSSAQKVETEHVTSSEYDYYWLLRAKKEHLKKHCRNCQYSWHVNTADATN